jgi:ribosomal-protein-alanine N-acetyltransferase
MTIVETPRLIIREFLPDEEGMYLDHFFTDGEVSRYLPKRSREERINLFRGTIIAYEDSKLMGTWGIFNKEDGEFIGSCLLRSFAGAPEKVELGYSMERKYWGKGIGTEMAVALVKYAFENMDIPQMVAVTVLENTGSQRVLEKAGFERMPDLLKDGMTLAYFELDRPDGDNVV